LLEFTSKEIFKMPVPDIKTDSNIETKIIVIPNEAMDNADKNNLKILKLRHPKTEKASSFLVNSTTHEIFEILSFEEEHRSWFIGSKVVSDGRLLLTTVMNPLFLVIPYLVKASKLVPLDQMLEDTEFPLLEEILLPAISGKMNNVADSKGDADLNVWKYNEEKTLEWLISKVKSLGQVLEDMRIDVTGGASSNIYQHTSNTSPSRTEYLRYGLGIVQEYLSHELGEMLSNKLDLPAPEKVNPESLKGSNKRMSIDQGDAPSKKIKHEGPTEDYSKSVKKAAAKEEMTAKEKALATSAKGTKNIMNFFKKK